MTQTTRAHKTGSVGASNGTTAVIPMRRVDRKALTKETVDEVRRLAKEWRWPPEQVRRWVRIWGRPDPPARKLF
jgi:hypothetical protein